MKPHFFCDLLFDGTFSKMKIVLEVEREKQILTDNRWFQFEANFTTENKKKQKTKGSRGHG